MNEPRNLAQELADAGAFGAKAKKPKERTIEERIATLKDVGELLSDPTAPLQRVPGRTLPRGFQWNGAEIEGRGSASTRRLKQQEKLRAKETSRMANALQPETAKVRSTGEGEVDVASSGTSASTPPAREVQDVQVEAPSEE